MSKTCKYCADAMGDHFCTVALRHVTTRLYSVRLQFRLDDLIEAESEEEAVEIAKAQANNVALMECHDWEVREPANYELRQGASNV